MTQKSYTAISLGWQGRLLEFAALLRQYRQSDERVVKAVAEVRSACQEISVLRNGMPVSGLDVLEVGSGQQSIQLAYFSLHNRAVGIDNEYSGERFSLRQVIDTWRIDGTIRTMKTVARKALGFDQSIRTAFVRELQVDAWPRLALRHMDAAKLEFDDETFDVVYSRAVFEHLSDPGAVLREIARVLRPGGVFFCLLHLYTSDSGCHDMRIFSGRRAAIPLWSHLRDDCRQLIHENTYLNRLRLADWRRVAGQEMPEARVDALNDDTAPAHVSELAQLRQSGELAAYSDEELLSVTVKVTWKKPAGEAASV